MLPLLVVVWGSHPDPVGEPVRRRVLRAVAKVGVRVVTVHHVPMQLAPPASSKVCLASVAPSWCTRRRATSSAVAINPRSSVTAAFYVATPVQKAVALIASECAVEFVRHGPRA